MKHYIAELENNCKEKLLIKELEKAYPNLQFIYREDANWIAELVVRDNEDNFIDCYQLTSFNVVKEDYRNSNKNRFEEIISTDAIRKIYIRFMKKNFPEYRDDYLKACNNTALDNLGELNNDF